MSMATARRMGFKSARVEAQKTGNKILQRLQEEGTVTWVAVTVYVFRIKMKTVFLAVDLSQKSLKA